MPLPLLTLGMEAIAMEVDKWRHGKVTADEAIRKIADVAVAFRDGNDALYQADEK